jgi:hypothetical protein
VWPTLEVIVTEAPSHLRKRVDGETGLALIDLRAVPFRIQSRLGGGLRPINVIEHHFGLVGPKRPVKTFPLSVRPRRERRSGPSQS